jgi:hypothetical protein
MVFAMASLRSFLSTKTTQAEGQGTAIFFLGYESKSRLVLNSGDSASEIRSTAKF